MRTTTLLTRNTKALGHACSECPKVFASPKALRMHVGRVHTLAIRVPREAKRFDTAPVAARPKRKYARRAKQEEVRVKRKYTRRAKPVIVSAIACPKCACDFEPLKLLNKPAQFCPSCGLSIPALVASLSVAVKHGVSLL